MKFKEERLDYKQAQYDTNHSKDLMTKVVYLLVIDASLNNIYLFLSLIAILAGI